MANSNSNRKQKVFLFGSILLLGVVLGWGLIHLYGIWPSKWVKDAEENRLVGHWRGETEEEGTIDLVFLSDNIWLSMWQFGENEVITRGGTYTYKDGELTTVAPEGSILSENGPLVHTGKIQWQGKDVFIMPGGKLQLERKSLLKQIRD